MQNALHLIIIGKINDNIFNVFGRVYFKFFAEMIERSHEK